MNAFISSLIPPTFSFLSSIASIIHFFLSIFFFIPCHIGLWIASQACHWILYGIQVLNGFVGGRLPAIVEDAIQSIASFVITAQGWIDWINQTLPQLHLPTIVKQYEKIAENYLESTNCCKKNNCESKNDTVIPPTTESVASPAPVSTAKASVDNNEGKVSEKTPTPSPIVVAPPPTVDATPAATAPLTTTTIPSIDSPSTSSQPGNMNAEGIEGKVSENIEGTTKQNVEAQETNSNAAIEKTETVEETKPTIEETKPIAAVEESKPMELPQEKTEIVETKESEKEIGEEKESVAASKAPQKHHTNGNGGGKGKNKGKNKNRR